MHYAPGGSVDGLILIEVDDLAIGTKRIQEADFLRRFQAAFRFGKWEKREASYAGRRIRQRDQYVLVDQEKYILEKLHPVPLREKQQKDRKLSLDEINKLRSLEYKISWVAKESRPEASGSASILAQHLKAPHSVRCAHCQSSGEVSPLLCLAVSHRLATRSKKFASDLGQ